MTLPPGVAADAAAVALVFVPTVAGCEELVVDGDDGHHLQRVRRVQVGESVVAADGVGTWATFTVLAADDGRLRLGAPSPLRREGPWLPRVAVAFAPAKSDHAASVVRELVELGVDRIVPIETRRSVVRWRGERGRTAVERLRRVAREAAMLAHRACVPEVEECVALSALDAHPAIVVGDRRGSAAGELAPPGGGEWLVVTGPEGGLEPEELARLGAAHRVAVGPHVLRARTAPGALAAALAGHRHAGPADLGH